MRAVRGSFNEEQLRVIAARRTAGSRRRLAPAITPAASLWLPLEASPGSTPRASRSGTFLVIDPDRADVVRWIFAHYGAGWSCGRSPRISIAAHAFARGARPGR